MVSGGHTTLYLVEAIGKYIVLGQTIDDAVGEAYDKVARMMEIPQEDRLSMVWLERKPKNSDFSTSKIFWKGKSRISAEERSDLDMSFSGLKTAVRNYLEKTPDWREEDVAASFQAAVVDVLLDRIVSASKETGISRIAIGGGVAANSEFRERITEIGLEAFIPPRSRCTDNGSMIAFAGRERYLAGFRSNIQDTARSRWQVGVE